MFEALNFKIYTKEAAEKLSKLFTHNAKEIKGNGTFEVIASTEGVDRDGEVIQIAGWDFVNYMKNPIILFGHEYSEMENIIGAATDVSIKDNQVIVKGIFASTTAGQTARQLYDDGILRAVSVGFIVKDRNGPTITKAELLELSFVSVPSNPDALSLSKLLKLETMLKTKTASEDETEEEEEETTEEAKEATKGVRVLTQEDIDANPILAELEANAGDAVMIQPAREEDPTSQDNPEGASVTEDEKAIKSGRVLSGKNATTIKDCIAMLQAVLALSEPEKGVMQETAKDVVFNIQALQKIMEKAVKDAKFLKNNI